MKNLENYEEELANLVITVKYQTPTPIKLEALVAGFKDIWSLQLSMKDIIELFNLKTQFDGVNDVTIVKNFVKTLTKL